MGKFNFDSLVNNKVIRKLHFEMENKYPKKMLTK